MGINTATDTGVVNFFFSSLSSYPSHPFSLLLLVGEDVPLLSLLPLVVGVVAWINHLLE